MHCGVSWDRAERILCVRLDNLGDVLMCTPAMRALGEAPGRHITLLASSGGAAIARLIPEIAATIAHDVPWMKHGTRDRGGEAAYALIDSIRQGQFDAAVIFTVYSQSPLPAAMLCYQAGIPLTLAHCRENPYALLSNWVPEPEPREFLRHEVRRQLELVATVGARTSDERLSLQVPVGARERVMRILRERDIDPSRPWLLVHPGATAASRRYAPESFAAVARRLRLEAGYDVLFTGSDHEGALIEGIRASMGTPSYSLAGGLRLDEFAALIALAPVLIANNTGPVHMAAALGTPVVDLYALTNPQHTPWQVPNRVLSHDVPCKYCYKSICPEGHHNCLRMVTPDDVFAAACDLLRECGASVVPKETVA